MFCYARVVRTIVDVLALAPWAERYHIGILLFAMPTLRVRSAVAVLALTPWAVIPKRTDAVFGMPTWRAWSTVAVLALAPWAGWHQKGLLLLFGIPTWRACTCLDSLGRVTNIRTDPVFDMPTWVVRWKGALLALAPWIDPVFCMPTWIRWAVALLALTPWAVW